MSNEPDLHVESLIYELVPSESIIYNNPPPIDFETDNALLRLADNKLTCTMKAHYSNSEQARSDIEPILRSWEVASDIKVNRGSLRFKYKTSNVVDRSPAIPGQIKGHIIAVQSIGSLEAFGTLTIRVTMNSYPPSPGGFRLSHDAESIWLRYMNYIEGREPLLSMAYFCLTVVTAIPGGKLAASKKYNIDYHVLKKLGELTSTRGDRLTARKKTIHLPSPLSGAEANWIEQVVKLLILRLGIDQTRESLDWISFKDLPALK